MTRTRFAFRAFVVVSVGGALVGACSKESAPDTSSLAPVSSPSAPKQKPCGEGQHIAPDGTCSPDGDPATSASSASASASASAPLPPGKCPEATNAERVFAFDWAKSMSVDAPAAAKLRPIAIAAAETKSLSQEVEVELKAACQRMAMELGEKGPFTSAEATCRAAVDALRDTRAKLGPAAKIVLDVHAPICPVSAAVATECLKKADEAASPTVACATGAVGTCKGTCDGPCELRSTPHCDGTCQGKCESGFTGTCTGTCKGTCDGKDMKAGGDCKGKCEGVCEGTGKGDCKGRCNGGCVLKAAACQGLCTGKCSVPVEDTKCVGALKVTGASADASAACEARAVHKVGCSAAVVSVRVSGAKDAAAGSAYERAIEHNLPSVMHAQKRIDARLDVLTRAEKSVDAGAKAITQAGGETATRAGECVVAYAKAASEGVASLTTNQRAALQVTQVAR